MQSVITVQDAVFLYVTHRKTEEESPKNFFRRALLTHHPDKVALHGGGNIVAIISARNLYNADPIHFQQQMLLFQQKMKPTAAAAAAAADQPQKDSANTEEEPQIIIIHGGSGLIEVVMRIVCLLWAIFSWAISALPIATESAAGNQRRTSRVDSPRNKNKVRCSSDL